MMKTRRPIAAITAAAAFTTLGVAAGGTANAAEPVAHSHSSSASTPVPHLKVRSGGSVSPAQRAQVHSLMKAVEDMPPGVAKGGQPAIERYLQQHAPAPDGIRALGLFDGWWDTTKCVASIAALVAGVALPASKILKLKAFIKKTGSVREAAELLIKVSTGEEKLAELGPVIGGLAAEILGISSVQENCS